MKKYIQPKIKAVSLNPDQAILQVCMLGGAYWHNNTTQTPTGCQGTGTTITQNWCTETPKGYPAAYSVKTTYEDSSPLS